MIGFGEILVIVAVAGAIIRPNDLPKIIEDLRHVRDRWNNFKCSASREIDAIIKNVEGEEYYQKKPLDAWCDSRNTENDKKNNYSRST